MKIGQKLAIGALAGAGAWWGTKAYLRQKRRIDLADRVVVITGASSGLGLLLARRAAGRGARLVLAARSADALAEAERELRDRGARDVLVVPTDVTDPAQTRALADRTIDHYGRVDVLINNAGIILVGPLEATTVEDFHILMATNFGGAVATTLAFLPHMRARRAGRIANVMSIGGRAPFPRLSAYVSSKFALSGLTRSLRLELVRDNIFVTGVYPMTIRTGGHTHAWFKGDQEAEYSWFGLADTVPGLSASAEAAADAILRGVCQGDAEVIIGLPTRLAIIAEALFPELSAEVLALIDRVLPEPANLDAPAVQGEDLEGKVPDLLNRLVPGPVRPG